MKTKKNEQNLKSPSIIHAKKRKVVDNSTTIFVFELKKNQGFRGKITSTLSTKSNMLYVFSALPLGSIAVLPGKNDASPTGFILFSEKHVQCVITVTSDYKNEKCAWKWKPKCRMEKKGMVG